MAASVSQSPETRRALAAAENDNAGTVVKSPGIKRDDTNARGSDVTQVVVLSSTAASSVGARTPGAQEKDAESPRHRPQPSAEAGSARKILRSGSGAEESQSGDDVEFVSAHAAQPALSATASGPPTSAATGQSALRVPMPKAQDNTSSGAGSGAKPKRMLQATLSFSEGTVEQQLRKDVADRDTKIEELTARLASTEASLANQTHGRAETSEQLDELLARQGRYQEAMKQLMIESGRAHRRDARRWQHQQHFELGHIAPIANPVNGLTEVWVEGNTARRLINSVNDIHARQRDVESRKVATGKSAKNARNDPDDVSSMLDADEELEMRKMELAALRSAEQQVQMQRQQYKEDIDAFVKEVRRIHEEDASPFALRETIGPLITSTDADGGAGTMTAGAPLGLTGAPAGSTGTGLNGDHGPQHSERYVLLYLLGRGGFSEVWKAFDLVEGRYVACKVHKVNRQWSTAAQRNYLKHAERELEIQRQLDHPRLMKLYDVFQFDSTTFVSVMEYSGGEDLERRLKRVRTLREPEARIILMQVLSALRHLAEQEKPVIHYDLKPANIIFHSALPSCLEVKVTDFGLSKVINDVNAGGPSSDPSVELTSQQCGTFYYLPPECFHSSAKISAKVDIWACGVIFYQMLYGRRPFASDASQADIYNNKLINSLARKGVDFPPKPPVSQEAKDIIKKCLTYDVEHRPSLKQLCDEPYFHSRARNAAKRGRSSVAVGAVLAAPRPLSDSSLSPNNSVMPPPS
jgi:tousled-like kinase